MRSIQLLFIESKVEGHVILFAIFLVGTCLSQTLVISVGIALFASIAVLQTTVYLVLEGINTRSFRCCSKVLNLYIVCAKVRTSGILLSYGTYAFSLFNKRPNGFYFLLLLSCLREHSEIVIVG